MSRTIPLLANSALADQLNLLCVDNQRSSIYRVPTGTFLGPTGATGPQGVSITGPTGPEPSGGTTGTFGPGFAAGTDTSSLYHQVSLLRHPNTYYPTHFGAGIGLDASRTPAVSTVVLGDHTNSTFHTSATDGVYLGTDSGSDAASDVIGIGRSSAQSAGRGSVCLGYNSGKTVGEDSVCIGLLSGVDADKYVTCIGANAGSSGGEGLTALGYFAGSRAGLFSTSLGNNAGNQALLHTTSVGAGAGYGAGQYATSVGSSAGRRAGQYSTSVGCEAGRNSPAEYSTSIGYQAGAQQAGESSVNVGKGAGELYAAANSITINATGVTLNNNTASSCKIAPIRNGNGNVFSRMYYDSATSEVTWGTEQSAQRYKTNIEAMDGTKAMQVLNLRACTFDELKPNRPGEYNTSFGFIAEEVESVYPEMVIYNPLTNEVEGVMYDKIVAPLVKMVQILNEKVQELDAIVKAKP